MCDYAPATKIYDPHTFPVEETESGCAVPQARLVELKALLEGSA